MARSLWLLLGLIGACVPDGVRGPEGFGDDVSDPQLPARGTDDVLAWIAQGHYLAWRCESAPHAARPRSAHGRNRICNNEALRGAPVDGQFPVGAAAVKEIYTGDAITAWAVGRKMTAGTGRDSWYWYEGNRDHVYANGEGDGSCPSCHVDAVSDYVFTVLP